MKTRQAVTDYEKQANEFAKKTGTVLIVSKNPQYRKYFDSDKEARYVFECKLNRNNKSFTFDFGQSIASGKKEPSLYDVLTSLTKYDPGTFTEFCDDFGYDTDSRTAEKTYIAVINEYKNVQKLFSDVMDELQEIQ